MTPAPDPTQVITVVGIGADGWAGLAAEAREALSAAEVVLGSPRQLDLVPALSGTRVPWPSPLAPALPGLLAEYADRAVCVLASGDPLFYGIGGTLVRLVGAERVRILPQVSSVALACARLGWPVEDVEVISAVGRPLASVHPAVTPGRRLLVLSADGRTPGALAELLRARGYGASELTVLGDLGGPDETRVSGAARTWAADCPALNVIAIRCEPDPGAVDLPRGGGLPEDAFEHDGQVTKREVRAVTLAALGPLPGQLLWDVGAGSGSVGIEWSRAHPSCRAIAIEPRADRCARIGRNAVALGVPGLRVVPGSAPEALVGLDAPDAVFIGGGVTAPGVVAACWNALRPNGKLVVNAVTLESEALIIAAHREYGGTLTRLAISRAAPLGGFTSWRPMLPVTQWTVHKGAS